MNQARDEDEEEVIDIYSIFGMVSKTEVREKVFTDSKYYFLRSVELLIQADEEFARLYAPYKLKKNVPKKIISKLLEHMDIPHRFVRVWN